MQTFYLLSDRGIVLKDKVQAIDYFSAIHKIKSNSRLFDLMLNHGYFLVSDSFISHYWEIKEQSDKINSEKINSQEIPF